MTWSPFGAAWGAVSPVPKQVPGRSDAGCRQRAAALRGRVRELLTGLPEQPSRERLRDVHFFKHPPYDSQREDPREGILAAI
jgi:hypothetical protein